MAKMLIELTNEEGKIVDVYKLVNNLRTKQDAIKAMIKHFSIDIKPKNLKEKEYFK